MEFGKINLHERCRRKYVCAAFLFWAVTTITSSSQTFTTLADFNGAPRPRGPLVLIQGFDGNFYGATSMGVASGQCQSYYCGTLFKMTPQGDLTTLHNFCTEANCPDGQLPTALLQATDGNFYGTTLTGGAGCGPGTLFRMTPSGKFTTLHNFCGSDGGEPVGLMQAADGNLYGTALEGGVGYGTVFKSTTAGEFTTLFTFTSGTGSFPTAGLIQARDGNFYGTTSFTGGLACMQDLDSCGTAFRLTSSGSFITIHTFCATDCSDGAQPGQLIQGADGSLYGLAVIGGYFGQSQCSYGCGTLFKITPAGDLSAFYTFCSPPDLNCANGYYPAALVQGTDGNVYGTASSGGDVKNKDCKGGCGTIFEITPAGALTTLHAFEYSDGRKPGSLIQSTNGAFYGVTRDGGSGLYGTVYSLSTGLSPFVELSPGIGEVGSKVIINGTDLPGTTAVTFDGVAAGFKIVAKTVLIAEVPTGATTGFVTVTTLAGTLTSNAPFQVIP